MSSHTNNEIGEITHSDWGKGLPEERDGFCSKDRVYSGRELVGVGRVFSVVDQMCARTTK